MTKNVVHLVSQEPCFIWLWFLVHLCKMMISLENFSFSKILIFEIFRWTKEKKNNLKLANLDCFALFLAIYISYHQNFCNDFYMFFLSKTVNIGIILIYLLTSLMLLISICFSSCSINTKNKFCGLTHLLHMHVICVP